MPIDTRDWYREKYGYKSPTSHKSYRPPRRRLPPGKIFLILLIVACVVATIYTGYLLFTHRTNWGVGAIVLAADIGVLIWNISAFRKWRVGAGTIISILVVIAFLGATACALGGVQPFSAAKNNIVSWFENASSQTPGLSLPPVSEYPADITGHVTITQTVSAKYSSGPYAGETMKMTSLEGKIYWIVDISVKNQSYENAVMANSSHWKIVVDDKIYDAQRPFQSIQASYPMNVSIGETGETTIRFPVPEMLKVSDARLCYRGQEPYSYGKLSGGNKVAAYDWDLKAVVEGTREPDQYEQYFVKKEVTGHKKVGKIGDIDITEPVYKDIYMKLETVGHWEKATSEDATPSFGLEGQPTGFYWLIGFNVSEAPWVVNWGYEARKFTALDPVGSKATFEVSIFSKADFDRHFYKDRSWLMFCHVGEYRGVSDKGVHCAVVQKTGHYVIVLNTKDVKDIVRWWVKVGVE